MVTAAVGLRHADKQAGMEACRVLFDRVGRSGRGDLFLSGKRSPHVGPGADSTDTSFRAGSAHLVARSSPKVFKQ